MKGLETIDQSIQDESVRGIVRPAMEESGAALVQKHGFDADEHAKYIDKIETRFKNPYIRDEVIRVGREPLRKLGQADRLVGPVKMATEFDLSRDHLLKGIAAAFHYDNTADPQSAELQGRIQAEGFGPVVSDVTGFAKDSEDYNKVIAAYEELKSLKG